MARKNLLDIEAFESSLSEQPAAQAQRDSDTPQAKMNYTISFPAQVAACTSRQFKVMYGDKLSLAARWVGVAFQSIIVGSLFYDLPSNALGVFPRGGILFFTLLFNALLAMAELTAAFESRPMLVSSISLMNCIDLLICQTV
jgi:hypothetical protein